jgi:hypothetical protein
MADSVSLRMGMDPAPKPCHVSSAFNNLGEFVMGRGILLWMLGVPLPVILLLAMCSHH